MSNEVAIAVERLSKRYRIGLEEEMHDTLFGAITSWIKSPLSNLKQLQKLTKFNDLPREIHGNDSEADLIGAHNAQSTNNLPNLPRSSGRWYWGRSGRSYWG